jgi:hypothetical protein
MKDQRTLRFAASAICLVAGVAAAMTAMPVAGASPLPSSTGAIASFDGQQINLAQGWGAAHACWTDGTTTDCYQTRAEMAAAHPAPLLTAGTPLVANGTCEVPTALFDQIDFGGDELDISTTATWVNLASLDFADVTQSYFIGACNTTFADGTNGSGSIYPTADTTANASAATMISGWSDRVVSVFQA